MLKGIVDLRTSMFKVIGDLQINGNHDRGVEIALACAGAGHMAFRTLALNRPELGMVELDIPVHISCHACICHRSNAIFPRQHADKTGLMLRVAGLAGVRC